jgi:hypothetical protein
MNNPNLERSLDRLAKSIEKIVKILDASNNSWDIAFDVNQMMDMKKEGWKVDRVAYNSDTGTLLYYMKKEH